jgi:orotate phosphoribosyltransferase
LVKPDVIAVATGAIGIGMLVAESMAFHLYMFVQTKKTWHKIRRFSKDVVVVEDLITLDSSHVALLKPVPKSMAVYSHMGLLFGRKF